MAEKSTKPFAEEVESLRKQHRASAFLAKSGRLPDAFARTFCPPVTAKQVPGLATMCENPEFEKRCFYQYKKVDQRSSFNWQNDRHRRSYAPTTQRGKVTDLASRALIEGKCHLMSVDTVINRLKTREIREEHEKWMVEGLARMEMPQVKREKEADNLREALQEWIEDAEMLAALNDPEMYCSVVSKLHKDDEEDDAKIISISFSTRFNGTEYAIKVEMSNDSEVQAKSVPRLEGIEEIITDSLASSSLADAITGGVWKLAGKHRK